MSDIKYYPLTAILVLVLLLTACSLVVVLGDGNRVTTDQTDDPTTTVKADSINVLNRRSTKEHK